MLWMGPASSFFDMVTFGGLYFILCPLMTDSLFGMKNAAAHLYFEQMFQTGWFVESLWSQMLIIHMLRTPRIPFLQSRASGQVEIFTASALTAVMLLPFTHGGTLSGGLVPLPPASIIPFIFSSLQVPVTVLLLIFNADYGRTTGYSLFNIPYYAPFFKSSGKYFAIIHEILIYDFFQ